MKIKRLMQILERLNGLYNIEYHNIGINDRQIILSDHNDIQVARISTKDESIWIDFRLVEDKEFPEDPAASRFDQVAEETPDDDIPF